MVYNGKPLLKWMIWGVPVFGSYSLSKTLTLGFIDWHFWVIISEWKHLPSRRIHVWYIYLHVPYRQTHQSHGSYGKPCCGIAQDKDHDKVQEFTGKFTTANGWAAGLKFKNLTMRWFWRNPHVLRPFFFCVATIQLMKFQSLWGRIENQRVLKGGLVSFNFISIWGSFPWSSIYNIFARWVETTT